MCPFIHAMTMLPETLDLVWTRFRMTLKSIHGLYTHTRARTRAHTHTHIYMYVCMYIRSIALAAPNGSLPDFYALALFGVASIILRGAACTINDLLDRDYDRQVTSYLFIIWILCAHQQNYIGLKTLIIDLYFRNSIVCRWRERNRDPLLLGLLHHSKVYASLSFNYCYIEESFCNSMSSG